MTDPVLTRRRFLAGMLAAAGSSAIPFSLNLAAMGNVAAADATDYKALVCLFLSGGNDHFNTLLPTDSTSWNEYLRLRTTSDIGSIALPGLGATGGVLPITPTSPQGGRTFALHPSLDALRPLFEQGRMAAVANVGTLVQPITLAQYRAANVPVPPKLFSHNDQQALWQSSGLEGAANNGGWGGRMGDILSAANTNANFTCISSSGTAVFLSGRTVRQYQVAGSGPEPVHYLDANLLGVPPGSNPLRQIITGDHTDYFQKEHAAVASRAIQAQSVLSAAMLPAGANGVPAPTSYINPVTNQAAVNPLALQMQTILRIIGGRGALGAKRQVFYVSLASFDTHELQRSRQADLLAQVAHAIAYFDGALASLQGTDMRKQVTLFTAADFGRTFASNGDGTDHGWGAHHFVVGGAVKGGDIYGSVPVIGLKHDLDVGSGALLPTISVDQYGATLASWFGLSTAQIADVFPNIANFSSRNLGFMTA